MNCPFCIRAAHEDHVLSNTGAIAFDDAYPVSPGHMLITPRRHASRLAQLDGAEQTAIWQLVRPAVDLITNLHRPDGFNIGINDGTVAGQTIGHVHLHVIPRYVGDVSDPRGGVRWVIPSRAVYWNPNDD